MPRIRDSEPPFSMDDVRQSIVVKQIAGLIRSAAARKDEALSIFPRRWRFFGSSSGKHLRIITLISSTMDGAQGIWRAVKHASIALIHNNYGERRKTRIPEKSVRTHGI